jgi:hypothetical protein
MHLQEVISKKTLKQNLFSVGILSATLTNKAGSGSVNQWYGPADPDPDPHKMSRINNIGKDSGKCCFQLRFLGLKLPGLLNRFSGFSGPVFSWKQAKNFVIFLTNEKLNQQEAQRENYSKPSSRNSIFF